MRQRTDISALLRRLVAAGSAALVLALTVFAASPQLHDWLHSDEAAAHDEGCAVTLFANGVSLPLQQPVVEAPAANWHIAATAAAEEIFLTTPRYLRQPERGPPVA